MLDRSRQMYDDFQLVYNNLASNLAPGLDIFEISMYLTKAYHAYVISTYQQYEQSESARKTLIELTRQEIISPTSGIQDSISDNSVFFQLPENILYIVYESITLSAEASGCFKNKVIQVTPVTHDDFHQTYKNPFKFNKDHALRLDIDVNGSRYSEIISPNSSVATYKIRYIKKPGPIILDNLTGTDKIDGLSVETLCELNPIYDENIVRLAAQMAYQDYKAA